VQSGNSGWFNRFSFLAGLLLTFAAILPAQTSGSIEGTLTDSSGAAIPGAKVQIRQQQSGVLTQTETNATGYFLANNLPLGTYEISVNQQGFKAFSVSGIPLDAATRVRRDIKLEVGQLTESITVEATGAHVDTSSGTVSSVITTEQIATAVVNGRNFVRLAMLIPGASYHSGSDEQSGAGLNAPGSPVSINGLNNKSAGWFVDGASDVNMGNGEATSHIPVLDTLAEVQVQTSNYSARYGTAGGAVINAITKSGTAQFHGGAYEYFRNDKLDARNFFSPTVPPLKQNQFGFLIGGPVIFPHYDKLRNKTFFFWSEDWRFRRNATTLLTATPTDAMRSGDFSAEAARTGKPLLDPLSRQPVPGNVIPSGRLNPDALLLLNTYFPAPNNPAGGFNNYINLGVGKLDPRTDTFKIDHNLSDTIRLSFTLAHDDIQVSNPNIPLFNASNFPGIRQIESTTGLTGNAQASMTLSPTTTNEVSYTFKHFNVNLLLADNGAPQERPAGLGIRDFYPDANQLNLIPNVAFSQGWGGIGTSQLPLSPASDKNFIISDNFSHVAGHHTLQMGISIFHYLKNQAIFNQTQGSYSFDGSFTNHPVADFLFGYARTYSQASDRFLREYSFTQPEWYVQDDWRVTPRLTLNLGLRFFVIPSPHVGGNNVTSFLPSAFDPAKAPEITPGGVLVPTGNYDPLNGMVFAGKDGIPEGFADTFFGAAPRISFAWDPAGNGKMAIRGGYGMSYLTSGIPQAGMVLNPPFNRTVDLNNVPLSDPSAGVPVAPRPVSVTALDPTYQRPRIQTWSLTAQKELPGRVLAQVGYVGSRGTNFEVWIDRNAPDFAGRPQGLDFDPRLNANTVNANLLRPFQGYGAVTWITSGLSSTYHSLQTSVQRRFSSGLALQGVYTFGRAIGESQTRRDMRVQNPLNWRADRGLTDFDRAHVFSMNYIYELPIFRGDRGFLGQVLGNWQLSGFLTAQSGLAMTPGISTGTRGQATRPDATGISPEGSQTKLQWFNTAAFTAPAPGMYGNAGVGTMRGPGFWIWDFSLSKIFPVTEKSQFRFSSEFYNFLNHTNWSGVSTALGSGNYGQITSARDARKVQLGLRFDF
jgi:hypothetical protein